MNELLKEFKQNKFSVKPLKLTKATPDISMIANSKTTPTAAVQVTKRPSVQEEPFDE